MKSVCHSFAGGKFRVDSVGWNKMWLEQNKYVNVYKKGKQIDELLKTLRKLADKNGPASKHGDGIFGWMRRLIILQKGFESELVEGRFQR